MKHAILFAIALLSLAAAIRLGRLPTATAAPAAQFDGPAELPRREVDVTLPQQTGKIISVREGDSLQKALDGVACGDTIRLQAGATFTGRFTFPARPCDDAHWIMVRTSSPDSALPPPGTRLTPCYAGVQSLPGRPALNCRSTQVVTARIAGKNQDGPITFAANANHYRFIGLEIAATDSDQKFPTVYKLAGTENNSPASYIIFDRVWMHGSPQDEVTRGVRLSGVTHAAIIHSTFTDFHCVSRSGACTDSQTISGGYGDLPSGDFLIENNFLEAAGENIMFGGGPGKLSPTDITIRRNHLFKPLIWQKGRPGFVGGRDGNPFVVKNNFELKVGVRVLFEKNVLDYSWGGFSQAGFAILLTPRNEAPTPSTEITDVTIRYCLVRHMGNGISIANPAGDPASVAGERYSIHDVIFEDIDHEQFAGHGNLAQVSMGIKPGTPALRHVKLDHITAFPRRGLMMIGGPLPTPMSDFTFTNNLVSTGQYGMTPTGSPCTEQVRRDPTAMLSSCFQSFQFRNNLIVGDTRASWPKGNFVADNLEKAGVDPARAFAGLAMHSSYRGKGSDGRDIGADWEAVQAAIAGVD
ncbi:MAG: hypothetical protein JST79_07290 [Acidobacteria bacterium]|nr:hypothetical protein [Acidobacteriota bacterium]